MYKIKTYNQIAARGLARLDDDFQVGQEIQDPHAILLRSHKLEDKDLGPDLLAIARAGAGTNNVPVQRCSERGVVVFNTPGANANSVKELVLAALLLSSRDVLGGMDYVRTLATDDDRELNRLVEAEKKRFKGRELSGHTLGVVGLGAIGSLVARAALDLGMEVIGFDPALSVDAAWRLPSEVRRMENLPSLFARADYVTLHVPSLPSTRGLVNGESLAYFRPGTMLLNFARQDIVEEDAVRQALEQGTLGAYFSDFPSTVLASSAAAHATPHLGASTAEAEENCAVMAADQLADFLRFGNIRHSVNFPAVSLELNGGYRLAVANRNVAGMLGHVLSALAEHQINVVDMINKSRDDVAYNLIDVVDRPSSAILAEINAIESVMSVRVFEI